MPQYIDMTPTWTGILPMWRRIVESNNSAKRGHREQYNQTMSSFWEQMEHMARAADQWNEYCQSREIASGAAELDEAKRITTLGDSLEAEREAYLSEPPVYFLERDADR